MDACDGLRLSHCLVLVILDANLSVVVYNETDQPFRNIAVSVGTAEMERPSLDARESAAFDFRPVAVSTNVRVSIDADPPLRWSAPSLANPTISRVTLRVDPFGTVTMTLEKTWAAQLSGWFD